MNKPWGYDSDANVIHPDWEHTLDGDYRPKGTTHTLDGDLVLPNGQVTTQDNLDKVRKDSIPSTFY